MKKAITKYWGVALIVVLLSTLFVAAAPASAADPLTWNREFPPSATNNILTKAESIKDVASNGDTFFAVSNNSTDNAIVYKSTNGGATWTLNNDTTTLMSANSTDLVALAPDDPNIVVVFNSSNTTGGPQAYVTTS